MHIYYMLTLFNENTSSAIKCTYYLDTCPSFASQRFKHGITNNYLTPNYRIRKNGILSEVYYWDGHGKNYEKKSNK